MYSNLDGLTGLLIFLVTVIFLIGLLFGWLIFG